ncbi:MAG: alpha-hydroxy-acid oxidizing protein [Bryobacteraceae bacterium]
MITRRHALGALLAAKAGAQQPLIGEPAGRIAPPEELINAAEFEAMARRKLDSLAFAEIAGSDRKAFDRITFRPRLMVNTMNLDLSLDLFGDKMFAPILAGPAAMQQRYHPEGELATVSGAGAAKAAVVVSGRSSVPFEKIAAAAKTSLWFQVFPEPDASARARDAIARGAKAICLTLGADTNAADWSAIDTVRKGLSVPFLLKGVMSPADAKAAADRGVQGIVVSSYRGRSANGMAATIEMLPAVADAVSGKIPILVDSGFTRGSDILKALALGARAVVVTRPVLWGLAAHGSRGVQTVLELIQTELARDMAMCGNPNLKSITKAVVRVHRW